MSKNKKLKIFFALIVLSIFFLPYLTSAQGGLPIDDAFGLNKAALATLLYYFLTLAISSLVALADMLNYLFSIGINDSGGNSISAVSQGWEIVRNFANMFFIIGLIVMAFATIFNISRYGFGQLIGRFLIAALLVNFSLVIGEVIIDASQSLSNIFIQSMGGSFSNFVAGNLDLTNLFGEPDSKLSAFIQNTRPFLAQLGGVAGNAGIFTGFAIEQISWAQLTGMFFAVILGGILAFSLLVAVIFTALRIPILWGLLILAPAAWVASIFPPTSNLNRMWWKYFIGWVFFLPIYLFYLYFGSLFISKQSDIISIMAPASLGNPLKGLGLSFQTVFFYMFTSFVMIYGAKSAMQGGMFAGAGGVAASIWAKSQAAARFSTVGMAGAGTGYAWSQSGAAEAYKEARERLRKEGLGGFERFEGTALGKMFRGERGREERAASIAGALGIPGVAERQLGRNVDSTTKRLKERGTHLDRVELERLLDTGTPEERIAAAQLFTDENYGALTTDQVTGVKEAFGGNFNTSLAASIFRKIKWNEMSADDLRQFVDPANPNNITDPNVRALIYSTLIEKRRATLPEFETGLSLARSSQARANMIARAKELLGEDLSGGDRQGLLSRLTDDESKRELVKIMAQKGDSFFHDATTNAPDSAQLHTFAEYFENPGERRKFLEDVSKKDAYSAAMEMLDAGFLRDSSGAVITRGTHANAEEEASRQILRKLSIEDKLSQHRGQYARADFQQRLAEDMSRNSSTLQSYVSSDKYAAVQASLVPAQREARHILFAREYLQPFNDQALRLRDKLIDLRRSPPTPAALSSEKQELRDRMLRKFTSLRDDYEKLCTKNNLMTDPFDQREVQAELGRVDSIIDTFTTQIA